MSSELATIYLGFELSSPVIVGSCPLTMEPEMVRQLVTAGAGAIVLPSIMKEQIVYDMMKDSDPIGAMERSGRQPQTDHYNGGPVNYLATIRKLKDSVRVPIFASMNGVSGGAWLDYAKQIESSGADGLELNFQSQSVDPALTSEQIEDDLCEMVRRVSHLVSIPIAVKLSQRFTNLALMARKLTSAGASGIVLFTHMPHWDVCVDRMHWTIGWELSPINSLGGILEGIVRVRSGGLDASIAASGGVRNSEDTIKTIIAGADVVMVTSQVYRDGPEAIRNIVDGVEHYLDLNNFDSLRQLQQARPSADLGPERTMRLEYLDPLTRSLTYSDPTPEVAQTTGDAYGHKR